MADKDFFSEDTMDDQNTAQDQQEAIRLGDKAYTPEELQELVGLGSQAKELEEKWNTKIDRLMPEYTKATQKISDYQKQLQDRETQQIQAKTAQGDQLSPEEARKQAQAQLRELGYLPESEIREIASQTTRDVLAGYQLLNEVQGLISQQTADGNPKTTPEDLLRHMEETGLKDPKRAYKDLFEEELEKVKEQKIRSLKSPGLYTESASSAGAKQPEIIRPTKDNLEQLVQSALRGS